jgi:hypothetical protein
VGSRRGRRGRSPAAAGRGGIEQTGDAAQGRRRGSPARSARQGLGQSLLRGGDLGTRLTATAGELQHLLVGPLPLASCLPLGLLRGVEVGLHLLDLDAEGVEQRLSSPDGVAGVALGGVGLGVGALGLVRVALGGLAVLLEPAGSGEQPGRLGAQRLEPDVEIGQRGAAGLEGVAVGRQVVLGAQPLEGVGVAGQLCGGRGQAARCSPSPRPAPGRGPPSARRGAPTRRAGAPEVGKPVQPAEQRRPLVAASLSAWRADSPQDRRPLPAPPRPPPPAVPAR